MTADPSALSVLPSLLILLVVATVAAGLALSRDPRDGGVSDRRTASIAFVVAIAIQAGHFIEEAVTGFHVRFPALFDMPPMPFAVFVLFNLAWIIVWMASVPGLRMGHRFALFAAWFLALAGALNGVAHPLMALADGGYFPGLFSSPAIGIAGIWLSLRLAKISTK